MINPWAYALLIAAMLTGYRVAPDFHAYENERKREWWLLVAFVPFVPMMVLSLQFNGTIISIVYIFVPVIYGLLYYFLHINFRIPTIIHCLLAGVGWVVSVGSASAFLSSIAIFYLIFIIFLFGPMRTRKAAIVWLVGQCGLLLIAIASGLTHDA